MHVFPVLAVKQVREDEKQRNKGQHINTNALTLGLHWLTHIFQEVYEVVDYLIVLFRAEATFGRVSEATARVQGIAISSNNTSSPVSGSRSIPPFSA